MNKVILFNIVAALLLGLVAGASYHEEIQSFLNSAFNKAYDAANNGSNFAVPEKKENKSVTYFDPMYGTNRTVELMEITTVPEWSDPTIITIVKMYTSDGTLVGVTVLYQNTYEKTKNFPYGDYGMAEYWQIQAPRNFEIKAGEEIAKEIASSFSSSTVVSRYYAYGRGHGIGYEE